MNEFWRETFRIWLLWLTFGLALAAFLIISVLFIEGFSHLFTLI